MYSIIGSIYDATTSIDYSLAQFEEFLELKKKQIKNQDQKLQLVEDNHYLNNNFLFK
jgi:hypothetical protein